MNTQNWLSLFVVLALVLFGAWVGCENKQLRDALNSRTKDTTITINNVTYVDSSTHAYAPDVREIIRDHVVYIDTGRNTVVVNRTDTSAIVADYFATRYYTDTLTHAYGSVVIRDSVTMNRIAFRRPVFNFVIPEKTVTITNTVHPARKLKLYGMLYAGTTGAGAGGLLQLKNGTGIGIAAGYSIPAKRTEFKSLALLPITKQ